MIANLLLSYCQLIANLWVFYCQEITKLFPGLSQVSLLEKGDLQGGWVGVGGWEVYV